MHQYRPGKCYQYDEFMTILKTASASSAVGHLRDVFLLAYRSTPVLGLCCAPCVAHVLTNCKYCIAAIESDKVSQLGSPAFGET